MAKGSLGRTTAPFNLRDLIKARDMLVSIMRDHVNEYHLNELLHQGPGSAEGDDEAARQQALAATKYMDEEDLRLDVLVRVLDTVYASRFKGQQEQQAVRRVIAETFKLPGRQTSLTAASAAPEVDDSVQGTVKIGSVYIAQGEGCGSTPPLRKMRGCHCVLRQLNLKAQHSTHKAVLIAM